MKIRTSMISLLLCVLFTIAGAYNVVAQYRSPRFAVTRADEAWLTYAYFINRFDSAHTQFEVGEFELMRNGSPAGRIYFQPDSGYRSYVGLNNTTYDTLLAGKTVTTTFSYQSGDAIQFFRKLGIGNSCAIQGGGDGYGSTEYAAMATEPRLAYFGLMYRNSIDDDTRFVVRLVDSASNQVVATLDSVGIPPNGSSTLASPYGTQPLTTNRTVALPSAYAGTPVYLRVDPYRLGSTPYGLGLSFIPVRFSLSSYQNFVPGGFDMPTIGDSIVQARYAGYMSALYTYYDSVLSANGCIEEMETGIVFISDSVAHAFLTRYFDDVDAYSSPMHFRARPCNSAKTGLPGARLLNGSVRFFTSPLQAESGHYRYQIDIQTVMVLPGLRVRAYEVPTGKLLYTSPTCTSGGTCQFVTPDFIARSTMFVLEDLNGVLSTMRPYNR